MSHRSRLFAGIFIVYIAAVGFLLSRIAADIDPRYRESAEESLVDTANLLATLLEQRVYDGVIPVDDLERTLEHLAKRPVYAKIFAVEKTRVDLHVYVTDKDGFVLFDSRGRDVGVDYLPWRDVQRTLEGAYGARTTRTEADDPRSEVMYVGAAIRERREGSSAEAGNDIIGMVAVGKPVMAFNPFVVNARDKLVLFGLLSVGAFVLLLLLSTMWLVRPFGLLRDVWHAAAAQPGGPMKRLRGIAYALRTAFENVRDGVVGKSYVDEYVATLTHELKSPLAAIRGAAELLREPMSEENRARFAGNIEEQVKRAQDLIDRLLELSGLERSAALERIETVSLAQTARAVADELAPLAERKGVALKIAVDEAHTVNGDPFLLQRALSNLMRNAIDFTPAASTVEVVSTARGSRIDLSVRDYGAGVPDFARGRVFDKFYSLPRPDTGKKGTGLGLAFVRQVAALHGGRVTLATHAEGGAVAQLSLPART